MNRSPSLSRSSRSPLRSASWMRDPAFTSNPATRPSQVFQHKINLVPVLRPEVRGRDRLFGPAHLLEDLFDGERLHEVPRTQSVRRGRGC